MTNSTVREPDCGEGNPLSTVNLVAPAVAVTLDATPDDAVQSVTIPGDTMPSDALLGDTMNALDATQQSGLVVASATAITNAPPTTASEPSHEQAARELGARWALEIRRSLRLEKRRAAGGWPGTKREAHARATWLLATLQSTHVERSFHATLVTDLATAVYASAKSTWLANAEEEDEDSDVEQ